MTTTGWAVGLMTGTVLDGEIDVALLRSDGNSIFEIGPFYSHRYLDATQELIRTAVHDARAWNFSGDNPASFALAESALTQEQSDAVQTAVRQASLQLNDISVVGFHGQTVLHRPPDRSSSNTRPGQTLQLGDGELMARETGLTIVHDFRSADMRQGGQGAPLAPVYHQALMRTDAMDRSAAIVNLGGISNLTWWDQQQDLIAFDAGPANAPIDDWVRQQQSGSFDKGGEFGLLGRVDEGRLQIVMQHAYFTAPFPKSLDRQDFQSVIDSVMSGLTLNDGAALLAAVCASAIDKGLALLPERPQRLILCGGGRHNQAIRCEMTSRTGCEVLLAEDLGWQGDAIEAECFAFLAERVIRSMPTSFPSTTGCRQSVCGGKVSRAISRTL